MMVWSASDVQLIAAQANDISANLHNKVTKCEYLAVDAHDYLDERGKFGSHAILAYAAKALKELHESQVIAGKGAGT